MKKYSAYLIFSIILTCVNLNSQNLDSCNNSLYKHSWSLQFAVSGYFTIQSLDGLMFSLKYHLSPKSAIRFGVGLSGRIDNSNDNKNGYSTNSKGNHENITLICSYLYYFNPKKNLNVYIGAGPRLNFQHSYEQAPDYENSFVTDYYKSNSWSAGLQASLGAEWFPVKYLSFFAEYSAYGVYQKSDNSSSEYDYSSEQCYNQSGNSSGWQLNANTARLGISLYF